MDIFLGFENDKRVIQLPINPSSLEMSDGMNTEKYDIIGQGEINIIKSVKLTEISFESFFPVDRLPDVSSDKLYEPIWYINTIKKWMESKKPVHFVVSSPGLKIDIDVSIESFEWAESGGAVGDIDYKLQLKRYKHYGAKKVSVVKPSTTTQPAQAVQQPSPRPDNRPKSKTYTIKAGDSLWKIAKSQLGDANRWKEIQKLNNIPDSRLKNLKVGSVIKLP